MIEQAYSQKPMNFGMLSIKHSIYVFSRSCYHNLYIPKKFSELPDFFSAILITIKEKGRGGQVSLMKSKLNVLYQIFLPQNPKNYCLLARISFNHEKLMHQYESDDPV